MEENANPHEGAFTDDDAVKSLLIPRDEAGKEKGETEAPQEAEADDESVEVEDTEESDAEASDEEAESSDDDAEIEEEPDRYTVKVNGEEVEVSLDELVGGYQREGDYRRKTQSLADERRAFEREREEVSTLKSQLVRVLQEKAAPADKEPDWAKLADDLDPWEFNKQRAQWDTKQREREQAQRHAQQLQSEQIAELRTTQRDKLLDAIPEWRDEKAFSEGANALREGARLYGFSAEDVDNTLDHRLLLILRDAVAYRKTDTRQKAVEKKVRKAPKVARPGASKTKADRRAQERDAARENLRKHGTVDAAVAFLLQGN